jgi:uncharacterized protein YndB with AHSA1/START domain
MLTILCAFLCCSATARADDVAVTVDYRDDVYEVHGRFSTRASVDSVWRLLTDYERIPGFVKSMKESTVQRRDGPRVRVRQVASLGAFPMKKTAWLTLEVLEERPHRIAFRDTLGRDFRTYSGLWELRRDSTQTLVLYTLEATPKTAAPHWIGRGMMSHAARDLLQQVRAEAERRTGAK